MLSLQGEARQLQHHQLQSPPQLQLLFEASVPGGLGLHVPEVSDAEETPFALQLFDVSDDIKALILKPTEGLDSLFSFQFCYRPLCWMFFCSDLSAVRTGRINFFFCQTDRIIWIYDFKNLFFSFSVVGTNYSV